MRATAGGRADCYATHAMNDLRWLAPRLTVLIVALAALIACAADPTPLNYHGPVGDTRRHACRLRSRQRPSHPRLYQRPKR